MWTPLDSCPLGLEAECSVRSEEFQNNPAQLSSCEKQHRHARRGISGIIQDTYAFIINNKTIHQDTSAFNINNKTIHQDIYAFIINNKTIYQDTSAFIINNKTISHMGSVQISYY